MTINAKKQAFIDAYCANGGNATEAAVSAGYSERSAHNQGCRLIKDDEVWKLVRERQREAADSALVTVRDVVKGLLVEAQTNGEGSTQSARVSAWKALSEFTGGFDANRQKVDMTQEIVFNMNYQGEDDE